MTTEPHLQALQALNRVTKDIYAGTVPHQEKAKRRTANKKARAARRRNR